MELQVNEVNWELMVFRVLKVFQELQVLMVQRVTQGLLELLVILDHQVCRECQERGASQALMAQRVKEVL